MIIKLTNHNYQYEIFQIVSLFVQKDEIIFMFDGDEGNFDAESRLDIVSGKASFRIQEIVLSCDVKGTDNKKSVKNALKFSALAALSKRTGKNIPWGILVGIRPTKLVHELIREGMPIERILLHLQEDYAVSKEKAGLAIEVAEAEGKYLDTPESSVSIYLGVPFCPTRCTYCSFASNGINPKDDMRNAYTDAVIKEITKVMNFKAMSNMRIDTLYIGGGTPTALEADQLDRILGTLGEYVDFSRLREFTVEAGRPDSITGKKLSVIKKRGCGRISINPQSMNPQTLKAIGRNHSPEDIKESFLLARNMGFNNINMDMIIGLPGEGEKEVNHTLDELLILSPESITVHTMALKRASVLKEIGAENARDVSAVFDLAGRRIRENGLMPYYMYRQKNMVSPLENVGYSKKGYECIYNIQMIAENIPIISFGADAVTKFYYEQENRIERAPNVKDLKEYIERSEEMALRKKQGLEELEEYFRVDKEKKTI